MGLPDIRNYYFASILDQMKHWFNPTNDKLWVNIERLATHNFDLPSLAIASAIIPKITIPNLISIKTTLFAWKHILSKTRHVEKKAKLHLPTEVINYCRIRFSVNEWISNGYNLYQNLPPNVKNIIENKIGKCARLKDFSPSNLIEIPMNLWEFLSPQKNDKKKGISFFYDVLSSQLFTKNTNMLKWEKDLDQIFSPTQWIKAFQTISKSSSCIEHWDNAQKIINRWYLTPYKLSKIYPTASDICWKCNEQTGNLLHTLWSCKTLKSFWNSISSFIANLTGNLTKLTPTNALLGIDLDKYPTLYRTIVLHILIASRITVASLWKSADAPNLPMVITRLNTQAQLELLLAYKNDSIIPYRRKWKMWLTHPKASKYLKDSLL